MRKIIFPAEHALRTILNPIIKAEIDDTTDLSVSFSEDEAKMHIKHDIDKEFQIELPLEILNQKQLTMRDLLTTIHRLRFERHPQKAEIIKTFDFAKRACFLIPPITGSSTDGTYLQLINQITKNFELPPDIHCMNMRLNPLDITDSIDLMAEDFVNYICENIKGQSCDLIGWSFGGVLAWKITEKLEAREIYVSLRLIDSIAPMVYQKCKPQEFYHFLFELVTLLQNIYSLEVTEIDKAAIEVLPAMDQIHHVFEHLIMHNHDNKRNFLLSIAARLLACQDFQPSSLQTSPCLLKCTESVEKVRRVTALDIIDPNFVYATLGWGYLKLSITLFNNTLSCNHFEIVHDAKNLEVFVKALKSDLDYQAKKVAKSIACDQPAQPLEEQVAQLRGEVGNLKNELTQLMLLVHQLIRVGLEGDKQKDVARSHAPTVFK